MQTSLLSGDHKQEDRSWLVLQLQSILENVSLRLCVVVGYLILVAVNVWAGIAGTNTDISAKYETPITPEGWAFSIWGIIFMLQGVWMAYSFFHKSNVADKLLSALAIPICCVWALECLWQMAFALENMVSASVIIVHSYAFALWALFRLYDVRDKVTFEGYMDCIGAYAALWSTSINTAWLSAATSIQLLITPISYDGVTEDDPTIQTVRFIIPAVLMAIAAGLAFWKRDVLYPLTICWAVSAIKARQSDDEALGVAASVVVGVCFFAGIAALMLRIYGYIMKGRTSA